MRQIPVPTLVDLCTFVDSLDASEVGELAVFANGSRDGAIFIEQGRVCWAAARGLARRLTALLTARSGVDEKTMEAHYRHCKKAGSPLGEWLVGKGVVSPNDLRSALLEHTLESLDCLCHAGVRAEWFPRSGPGHAPRFTFATAELVARASASGLPDDAMRAARELSECFYDDEWGAAFVRNGGSAAPTPIAVFGRYPDAATALLRAGKWASSTLDLADALRHDNPLLSIETRAQRMMVAFRSGGTIVLGETSVHGPARILNRRGKLRRMSG